MTIKSHIASSGKKKGQYVPCPAKKKCTIASAEERVEFAGQPEMDMYNDITKEGKPLGSDTVISDLLQHGWAHDRRSLSLINAIHRRDIDREKLKDGESIEDAEHDTVMDAIREGTDLLWGADHGLGSSRTARTRWNPPMTSCARTDHGAIVSMSPGIPLRWASTPTVTPWRYLMPLIGRCQEPR